MSPSMRPAFLLILAACGGAKPGADGEDTGGDNVGPDGTASGAIAVDPGAIDFGLVNLGASATASIAVIDVGTGPVEVTLALTGDPAFAASATMLTLDPRTTEIIDVVFTPTTWGAPVGTLILDEAISGGHLEIPLSALVQEDADGDGYTSVVSGGDDCLDSDPTVHPGAADAWYDGVDADCAGGDDFDQDGDGYALGADCDDTDPTVFPGTSDEWYDGVDADCAGNDDDDQDGDGYPLATDCDDTDPALHPAAIDLWYDGVDTDCAGNDDFDQDGDGSLLGDDCDDTNASFYPGAPDEWYDGLDNDCAENDDFDQDGDGVGSSADCDDTDPLVYPGAPDAWYDGVDADCAGNDDDDQDGDGWGRSVDCDDTDTTLHPGAADAWYDGVDTDCAGNDDFDQDGDSADVAVDCDDTDPTIGAPSREVLDGIDNDCDGALDEVTIGDVASGVVYGPASGSALGAAGSLALDADVTGDGMADLVTISRRNTGAVWLVSGAALVGAGAAVGDVATATAAGASSTYPLTYVATPAGDLDANGTDDWFFNGTGSGSSGRTWVISDGSATGTVDLARAACTFSGDGADDSLMATGVGDLDGDGADDVVTGTPLDNNGRTNDVGNVTIFVGKGATGALTLDNGVQIEGVEANQHLGEHLVVADLTGDGYADVLAGAPGDDAGGADAGAAFLIPGNAGFTWSASITTAASDKLIGARAGDALGADPIPMPGDLDGDGLLDIALGSATRGTAWILLGGPWGVGSTSLSAADFVYTGTAGDDVTALAVASDLDGDGLDELVIGGAGEDTNGANSGVVWILRWSAAWSAVLGSGDAVATIAGSAAQNALGSGLAAGGDADGDGRDDLAIGATGVDHTVTAAGAVYLLSGW